MKLLVWSFNPTAIRSIEDIEVMSGNDFKARCCTGIYKEEKTIAGQDRNQSKDKILTLAKTMEVNGAFSVYSKHDYERSNSL